MQLRGGDDDHFGGIDIGGTKIGVCLGHGDGRIVEAHRFATDHTVSPEVVLAAALAALDALAARHGTPKALGVACPGPITVAGRFLDPPNMPRWHGFDLAAWLRAHTKTPATTMNDANAGVLAEWLWGAARGADTAVFCTMSTGMGAGLIVGGELHQGRQGFAAEIGHLRLAPDGPVGFGKRGSVEGFLSGPGIVQVAEQEARAALQTGAATGLVHDGRVRELTAETVCQLARAGDGAAARAIARCADKLGELLAVLVDLLEPDVIVLGTIAASHPDLFLDRAWARLREEALAHSLAHLRVEVTSLTDRGDRQAIAAARAGEDVDEVDAVRRSTGVTSRPARPSSESTVTITTSASRKVPLRFPEESLARTELATLMARSTAGIRRIVTAAYMPRSPTSRSVSGPTRDPAAGPPDLGPWHSHLARGIQLCSPPATAPPVLNSAAMWSSCGNSRPAAKPPRSAAGMSATALKLAGEPSRFPRQSPPATCSLEAASNSPLPHRKESREHDNALSDAMVVAKTAKRRRRHSVARGQTTGDNTLTDFQWTRIGAHPMNIGSFGLNTAGKSTLVVALVVALTASLSPCQEASSSISAQRDRLLAIISTLDARLDQLLTAPEASNAGDVSATKARLELLERQYQNRRAADFAWHPQNLGLERPQPRWDDINRLRNAAFTLQSDLLQIKLDMAQGLFCSECMNSKFEIEKSAEAFNAHLARVKGTAVPATFEQLEAKEAEYAKKIAAPREKGVQIEREDGERLQSYNESVDAARRREQQQTQALLDQIESLRTALRREQSASSERGRSTKQSRDDEIARVSGELANARAALLRLEDSQPQPKEPTPEAIASVTTERYTEFVRQAKERYSAPSIIFDAVESVGVPEFIGGVVKTARPVLAAKRAAMKLAFEVAMRNLAEFEERFRQMGIRDEFQAFSIEADRRVAILVASILALNPGQGIKEAADWIKTTVGTVVDEAAPRPSGEKR